MSTGAGGAEEHHVVLGDHEVQGPQVGDGLAFEAAGVVVVEVLQGLAGREPGGADAAFPAVGFPGGDLALQGGDQELLRPQDSARPRSSRRGTASRRVGAFSARVKKASSAVRSRPGEAAGRALTAGPRWTGPGLPR